MSIQLLPGLANESLDRVLEDLLVRFIVNASPEELSSNSSIFFLFEEAHWFYLDYARQLNSNLPLLKMKAFCKKIIEICPIIWNLEDLNNDLKNFVNYKQSIPVRGAALFNSSLNKILLVQGVESASWSFPRGKISKDETDENCAIREVKEEIGFDITPYLKKDQFVERNLNGKNYKIYLCKNIPEDFKFKPIVKNEIKLISWLDFKKIKKQDTKKFFLINSMHNAMTHWVKNNKGEFNELKLKLEIENKLKSLLSINEVKIDPGRDLLEFIKKSSANKQLDNIKEKIHEQRQVPPPMYNNFMPFAPIPLYQYPIHPMQPIPMPFPVQIHNNLIHQHKFPQDIEFESPNASNLLKPSNNLIKSKNEVQSKELLSILNRSNPKEVLNLLTESNNSTKNENKDGASYSNYLLSLIKPKEKSPSISKSTISSNNASNDLLNLINKPKLKILKRNEPIPTIEKTPEASPEISSPNIHETPMETFSEDENVYENSEYSTSPSKELLELIKQSKEKNKEFEQFESFQDEEDEFFEEDDPLEYEVELNHDHIEKQFDDLKINDFKTEKKAKILLKRGQDLDDAVSPSNQLLNLLHKTPTVKETPQVNEPASNQLLNLLHKTPEVKDSPSNQLLSLLHKKTTPTETTPEVKDSPSNQLLGLLHKKSPPEPPVDDSPSNQLLGLLHKKTPVEDSPSNQLLGLLKNNPSNDLMSLLKR